MVRKFKRAMSRILASVLACGMLITYCPSVAYAMDENPPEIQEEVTEPEVSAPVETQPSEPAPTVSEPAPAPAESPEVTTVEDNEQEVTPPAEEEPVITDFEQEEPDDEDLTDPTEDEEANEEETIPEEEEVVEEELTTSERPKMKMMMLGAAPGGTPGNDPTPDPKGTPEDAEKYYPNNSNMQDLYIQYGDEFKDASDKMIDEPSNDKLVEVVNTMNDSKVSNPEDVPGLDENRNSIGEVVMVEGEDKDGDGSPDPQYFKYEKDPVTNEVKITRLEEKAVKGLTDSKVEEESKINEIIAKYGEENTDVKKYYDEVPKEIKQPKNGGHHVNLFPTNQNGVKFEEPITTTDSNGNMVYLWNYKFDFAGETATVEQGNLRWDTSKKRDYGDRGFGCWIFVDKNNKEWNLTNMSTTSTGSHQIKAVPYSDDYMNSIEKDLYEWFVENGDKNGQGNTYQYGDIEKIFKYAIVNAEGWNYFEELDSKIIAKSKLPDTPPGPEPPGPEPPGPEPPG
ncbi:MAG: hypothetical protein MJ246_07185, partial [Clostridia bacterium]|nr:hypothetical protein [Clostridia bacterium]